MNTIALCMIVKNEEHIIERCLESVHPIIDFICICDTGSTDSTKSKILHWLERTGIPGQVLDHNWTDFGTNRSKALHYLRYEEWIKYALMMDADDQLVINPDLDIAKWKESLNVDMYDVEIYHNEIRHWRPQIFSNRKKFRYRGVLHEFVEGPSGHTRGTAEGIHIIAGVEGSRSRDPEKYLNDARMLEKALETETDELMRRRYTFYLAQSYKDTRNHPQVALQWYKRRAEMGGWEGDLYISLFQAAQLMAGFDHIPGDTVIGTYLRAFEVDPSRAEALRYATNYCHRTGRHHQGFLIGKHGTTIPQPTNAKLFLEPWVYEWGMLDDFSVAAYWSAHYAESLEAATKALEKAPPEHRQRVIDNIRFAKEKLYGNTDPNIDINNLTSSSSVDASKDESKSVDFTVVSIDIPGYVHSGAYAELAETVFYGLSSLGYMVELRHDKNWSSMDGRIIVIGAHLLDKIALPDDSIIYNTEHHNNINFGPYSYYGILKRHPGQVWDYSEENSRKLTEILGRPVKHVPVGYAPELTRIEPSEEQDIDVLFYGALNERRTKILEDLRTIGLKVEHLFGVYGPERDKYIARAKVVLSMHYYLPGVFEALRISYLLANKKAVVCEVNEDEEIDRDVSSTVWWSTYEHLVQTCKVLIGAENARKFLEKKSIEIISKHAETNILRTALRRKVWDCFLYNGEADVLTIRLHELKDVVDRFVIVEADTTFSGKTKEHIAYMSTNWILYQNPDLQNIRDKIDLIYVNDMPETTNPWEREAFQRNAITRGLDDAAPDDLIMISDVDEIPRASVVREMAEDHHHSAFALKLAFNYFYLNYQCTSGQEADRVWNCAVTRNALDKRTPDILRYNARAEGWAEGIQIIEPKIIENAGWHFSYLGDDEAVREKIRAFSHQEYNTEEVLNNIDIDRMVENGEDLFGRPGYGWKLVETDDLPEWVKSQPEMMKKWTR